MNAPWRKDPNLRGEFHPDFPDHLEVMVHAGGPRITDKPPELMWVRVVGMREGAYVGTLLNEPEGLVTVRQGERILFLAVEGSEYPVRVTEKYLRERQDWDLSACDKCGFTGLFDAPSDLIRKIFPEAPEGTTPKVFTSFCPLCGGVQSVCAKSEKPQT